MKYNINHKPFWLFSGEHLETIIPGLFRKVNFLPSRTEVIDTPDGDFLEIDWFDKSEEQIIILSHGLEGDSTRSYIRGMARVFNEAGYSALAWNYRGCGRRLNLKPRLYHSGATDDLQTVVDHIIDAGFKKIVLCGFSLGGNLTLKYVGERGAAINPAIIAAIAFSVPIDLDAGCSEISKPSNRIYANRFLRKLKRKVRKKHEQFPHIDIRGLKEIKDLRSFDDRFTAPIHGFKDAEDYYARCNSKQFLPSIAIPTLIVNAQNDPFLSSECYLSVEENLNSKIRFEAPAHGGHVGFSNYRQNGSYWSELKALDFIQSL